jgi:adenylate kinase
VRLLTEELARRDEVHPVFVMQTGQYFRDFVKTDNYAASIAKHAQEVGDRQPDFLAMWIWADTFVKSLKGNEHIILDGSPRSLNEAQNLDLAMKFFKRPQPTVVYLNVPRRWSREHLLERSKHENRPDDTPESIEKRLSWFDIDVRPAIEYYRRDRHYDFIEIDGTRSIEEVREELHARIFGDKKVG